jgi:hypothetical protein
MTWLAVPVALSGYVLQALIGDAARRWTGWLHAGIGLLFAAAYVAHPRRSRLPDDAAEDDGPDFRPRAVASRLAAENFLNGGPPET